MNESASLMHFPCDFVIKIIGKNHCDFLEKVMSIVHQYFPETSADKVRSNPSKQSNYLAISITLHVTEKSTLDELYVALTKNTDISMVL